MQNFDWQQGQGLTTQTSQNRTRFRFHRHYSDSDYVGAEHCSHCRGMFSVVSVHPYHFCTCFLWTGLKMTDWTQYIAPFWSAVIQSAPWQNAQGMNPTCIERAFVERHRNYTSGQCVHFWSVWHLHFCNLHRHLTNVVRHLLQRLSTTGWLISPGFATSGLVGVVSRPCPCNRLHLSPPDVCSSSMSNEFNLDCISLI